MKTKQEYQERAERILILYMNKGEGLQKISIKEGLTRERIRQILSQFPRYINREKKSNLLNPRPMIECVNCGKTFKRMRKKMICCNGKCQMELTRKFWRNLTEKECTVCKIVKKREDFYERTEARGNDMFLKLMPHCKKCHAIYVVNWNKNNPEKRKEIGDRASKLYYQRKKLRKQNE